MKSSGFSILVSLLFAAGAYYILSGRSSSEALAYQHDWSKAREEALREKKPIILFFGGPWCPSCVQLERTVFASQRVQELSRQFVCVKVDPRDLGACREAMEYKTTRFVPEVRFLDPQGEVVEELQRGSPDQVAEQMQSVLEGVKRKSRG
jgi:thioredoxin-related protein